MEINQKANVSCSEEEPRRSKTNMGEAEVVPTDEKQVDSGAGAAEESVVWSQEVEVCLFHAMLGHKPVGKRHFCRIVPSFPGRPRIPGVEYKPLPPQSPQRAGGALMGGP